MYVPSQIKAGDEIFSPFVAAGWESAVEKNMRPAQWLGFLKIMTALGAEYVETGFFTPLVFSAKWKNVQLPQNYVWQAAAPAYAQVSAGTTQCTVSPTVGALALSHNSRTLSLSLSLSTHRQRSVCGRIYSSTAILSTRQWTMVACPRPPSLKPAGTKGASVVYSCRSSVLSSDSICLCCTAVTCKLSSRGNCGGDRC